MAANLKFAVRQLRKSPGFTTVALLTLGLGIGACTAMFSIVNAVLLRPLPFAAPNGWPGSRTTAAGGLSARTTRADTFKAWREQNKSFEALAAYFAFFDFGRRPTMTGAGDPARLRSVGVSDNFLDVLGVPLALGRNFTAEECRFNGPPVAILSHAFWQRRFNGDPDDRRPRPDAEQQRRDDRRRGGQELRLRLDLLARQRDRLAHAVSDRAGDGAVGQYALRHRPPQAGRHRRTGAGRPARHQPAVQAVDQLRRHARRPGHAARRGVAREASGRPSLS